MQYKVNGRLFDVPDDWIVTDGRYWEFIVYEDSAPDDWLYKLDCTGLKVAISPYHDKDVIEGTDRPKKPHWHVLCIWGNKTTFKNALSYSVMLNCPIPHRKDNVQGAYEYHTHKNHANKYQYSDKDRKHLNGLTKSDISTLSVVDIRRITTEVISIIRLSEIYEYGFLIDYLVDNQLFEHFDYVSSHTLFFDRYISSRRYSQNKNEKN